MRVCKHGCGLKMFCFSRVNHASTNLSFRVQNASSLLYLPVPFRSSAETWKIVAKKVCHFFFFFFVKQELITRARQLGDLSRKINVNISPVYTAQVLLPSVALLIQKCPRMHLPNNKNLRKQDPITIVLPFKDQKSANSVRRQLGDPSGKINVDISPVYPSRKIKDEIKVRENKPPLVNQQCVVYNFQCNLCDAGYVVYMCRHLHQWIEEHKVSTIGNHLKEQHDIAPDDIAPSLF